jgi:DNA-binding Lrp family transcriptional regulator
MLMHLSRVKPHQIRRVPLDDIDHKIIQELLRDARKPNNAIAAAVGIAPSTCLARIRGLQERGVIRGFRADIDLVSTGRGLQALIALRLHSKARSNLSAFSGYLASLPSVEGVFFVSGDQDFLVHVAVADSAALRALVAENLSVRPEVAGTNTSVIFEYVRPTAPVQSAAAAARKSAAAE